MKNILITGGAGFIGSHLVDSLLAEKGWGVTVLDDFNPVYSPILKYHNIARYTDNPAFSLYGGDIVSEQVMDGIFSDHDFDCVVHLADRSGVLQSVVEPQSYEKTNIHGTLNVLEAARKHGVKQFIFGSSAAVYGNNPSVPLDEEMEVSKPISPYGATKSIGEILCHTYSHLYNMRCLCLRFFSVYGPRQRPDMAVYKFTHLIEADEPVTLYGDGNTQRDYTYISDIINGMRRALTYDQSRFEIINLGSGTAYRINDLVTILERKLGRKAFVHRLPPLAGEVSGTLADIRKARDLLGYAPQISIETGIDKFLRWFKKAGHRDELPSLTNEGARHSGMS